MRNRFDHFAKQLGEEALGASGATVAHAEISPETQHADLRHEPDPSRSAERARLGLLGRIAAMLCLIEIYSHAPGADEFRACLSKHLAFWQQRVRNTRSVRERRRRREEGGEAPAEPFLWIISAGTPTSILTKLPLVAAPDWPTGVYFFGGDILRVGIIVATELPCDRSTLLVRLMAAGPLLPRAIRDLGALPPDAHERAVAERILLELQRTLARQPTYTEDEQEFTMTMYNSFEEIRDEGRAQGIAEAQANAVLSVLRVRGIAIPEAARARILAQKDAECLQRWHEKAIVAASIEDVLDDPK